MIFGLTDEFFEEVKGTFTAKEIRQQPKLWEETYEIIKNNTSFLTSKKDSSIHGIGLNNVRKSVEKYSGELVTSYSNNKFTLKIMIPCNSEV